MSIDYGVFDRNELNAPLFYPRGDRTAPPAGASDHRIEVEPGVSLSARWYASEEKRPTLLYFHGNGEVISDHDDVARLYHYVGLDLFVVDYRGYGKSTGRPSVASLVGDAHAAAARLHELLDERGASEARFVMGRSLGGHPALEIAANAAARFRGVILESSAGDIRRLLKRLATPLGEDEARALVEAHEAKIARIALPVLMLHGEEDNLVSLESAKHVHDILRTADRKLVVIAGAGHNDILEVGGEGYFRPIVDLVARAGS